MRIELENGFVIRPVKVTKYSPDIIAMMSLHQLQYHGRHLARVWNKQRFIKTLKSGGGLYIEKNNKGVGFVVWDYKNETTAHIMNIIIDSRYRGAGLGTTVMNTLISQFLRNGIEAITLEVEPDPALEHFYTKLGFSTVRRIDNFYRDADANFMEARKESLTTIVTM
eukprot:TRINITY_DN3160_c2_g2_i1.p1 TRINITY_DN3160_c2_g2~~TRINITY_DN3160_c2_g2_i1.p1  ORF type:complete len:167 (-),score=19.41 TRINITY_DN3160_c2_g2_i1:13-513(-)